MAYSWLSGKAEPRGSGGGREGCLAAQFQAKINISESLDLKLFLGNMP